MKTKNALQAYLYHKKKNVHTTPGEKYIMHIHVPRKKIFLVHERVLEKENSCLYQINRYPSKVTWSATKPIQT